MINIFEDWWLSADKYNFILGFKKQRINRSTGDIEHYIKGEFYANTLESLFKQIYKLELGQQIVDSSNKTLKDLTKHITTFSKKLAANIEGSHEFYLELANKLTKSE